MTTDITTAKALQKINLTQMSRGLKRLNIAVGWRFNPYGGKPMDVDLCAFILGRDGQTREDEDFVFYNNMAGAGLAVKHLGDNTTGLDTSPAMTDAEQIMVDLDNLSFDIFSVVFVLSIYQGNEHDQAFDVLNEAIIRIENADNGEELVRTSVDNKGLEKAVAFKIAELTREGVDWSFKLLKEPAEGGLNEIAKNYGLLISSTG